MRSLYLVGLAYLGLSAFLLIRDPAPVPLSDGTYYYATADPASDGSAWFREAKPYCNTLEVETLHRRQPPPTSLGGIGFSAACWALAGRIDEARNRIMELPSQQQWKGAGIVFAIGHPIADMGDDRSAGPIMELVIEFWPNHYQALYHAGTARFALGEFDLAQHHLESFLTYYDQKDGWTRSARTMLEDIASK